MSDKSWNPFASEYITTVGTSISRAVHDNLLPTTLKTAIIAAIFQNISLPANMIKGLLGGLAIKAVYLDDIIIHIPPNISDTTRKSVLDQWGSSPKAGHSPIHFSDYIDIASLAGHTIPVVDVAAVTAYAVVKYSWETGVNPKVLHLSSMVVNLDGYDINSAYFQVKYFVGAVAKYFMYGLGDATYPSLDALFDKPHSVTGEFFPFIYFRFNKESMLADTASQEYITSEKLVKYLGMNYADVIASIHNPEQIPPSDLALVEQAMLMAAVPAITVNSLEQRYLFEYFDVLYQILNTGTTSLVLQRLPALFGMALPAAGKSTQVIQDKRFKMTLANEGVSKRLVAGNIGKVDSYTSAYSTEVQTKAVTISTGEGSYESTESWDSPLYIYRKQISTSFYEEIIISNLTMTYFIYGQYTEIADNTESALLVPIDTHILNSFSTPDQEMLFSRSLHYIFNSRQVQEVEWYQQAWFQIFIIIIAVVVAYIYPPIGGWTLELVLQAVATAAAINIIMPYLVKAIGIEAAFIVAIIAAVVAGYQIYDAGSLAAAPFAGDLLMLTNGLFGGISENIKDMFELLAKEASEFSIYVAEQLKTIETLAETLASSRILSTKIIIETSEQFLARSLNNNPGIIGVGVADYFDRAFRLPTVHQTLGEPLYGTYSTT